MTSVVSEPDVVTRLFVSLGRLDRTLRRETSETPVGNGALSLLSTLVAGGPARLGRLAAVEGVSAPSMTRIVTSLESVGHVRRTPDPLDRRAWIVEATDSGREIVLAGREARMQALRRRLDTLPEEQRDDLVAALPALELLASPDSSAV